MEFLILIALLGIGLWVFLRSKRRTRADQSHSRSIERLLASFGYDTESREAAINKAFDEKTGSIDFHLDYQGKGAFQVIRCDMGRTLAAMSARDREALRSVLLLRLHNLHVSENNTWSQSLGIIYGDGKATIFEGWKYTWPESSSEAVDRNISSGVEWLIGRSGVEPSVNTALRELTQAVNNHPEHPTVRMLAARLLGTGGDLAPAAPLVATTRDAAPAHALVLGLDEKVEGREWVYNGEGSLLTVAPPGSGKTQCHVFPNLLQWPGPAVVLDVKGEIYAQTSKWRAENVGPVFRFNPLEPGQSHCYNPLSAVRPDLEYLWEDSRFLADMMIVPSGAKDPFWESRARDVVTAAIAYVCIGGEERPMADVMDILHGVGWDRFVAYMQARTDFRSMSREGHSLAGMEPKTRDSVLQQALSSLSAWDGERISRATVKSDWRPLDLRGGTNPTIYICLRPNEIDSYVSLLRVLIAQHIRVLTADLPPRDAQPILFLLDELPRLRQMPPVEEALEIGRQYGLRLWMFTQSLGQLENAYPNAEGMVASCAVRMFMNPSLHDETAQKISDDIGLRESIIDGTRVKVIEPNVLAGPDFKDSIIVMAPPAHAARLRKNFAYVDAELAGRMGALM